jgi:hypothetical protein
MQRYLPLLFFSAFILIIDLYAWQAIRFLTEGSSEMVRRIITLFYWFIPLIAFALMSGSLVSDTAAWPGWFRVYFVSIIVFFYILKVVLIPFLLVDDLQRFFRWIVALVTDNPELVGASGKGISRFKFLMYSGTLVSGFLGLNLLYGMIRNAYRYKLHKVTVDIKLLPRPFQKFRIVQISDIHSGSFTRTEPVLDAVKRINELEPDVILFTGDLVNNVATEAIPFKEIFSQLKARYGVFSVLGNHDYGDYYQWDNLDQKRENMTLLEELQRDMGWKLLRNQNYIIEAGGHKLAIIGVENWSSKARFPKYGKLDVAYSGVQDADVKILMSHDPSHWEGEVLPLFSDINLMLAGHTHGFQFGVEIPGFKWSPSQYVYKQWAGLYRQGEQYLYVNRGFGFLGYPGRVGILPEISLIELRSVAPSIA